MLFTIIMKFIYVTFNFSDKFVSTTGIPFYVSVIDWYFNDNLIKILFPDNVICGFLNIMLSC